MAQLQKVLWGNRLLRAVCFTLVVCVIVYHLKDVSDMSVLVASSCLVMDETLCFVQSGRSLV